MGITWLIGFTGVFIIAGPVMERGALGGIPIRLLAELIGYPIPPIPVPMNGGDRFIMEGSKDSIKL